MDFRIIQIKLCLKDQFWPAGFLLHLESDKSRSSTFQGLFTKRGGICKLSEAIPFSGGSRGEAGGAALPPLIFRPNWGPKGRKKFETAPPPLSQGLDGLDDCPPSAHSLKVYIRHWPFTRVEKYCGTSTQRKIVFTPVKYNIWESTSI